MQEHRKMVSSLTKTDIEMNLRLMNFHLKRTRDSRIIPDSDKCVIVASFPDSMYELMYDGSYFSFSGLSFKLCIRRAKSPGIMSVNCNTNREILFEDGAEYLYSCGTPISNVSSKRTSFRVVLFSE